MELSASGKSAALIAGISTFVLFFSAMFAELFVRMRLIIPEDEKLTAQNLSGHGNLFVAGLFSYAVTLILDLVIAIALYRFLQVFSKRKALNSMILRIVYTIVFAVAVFKLGEGFFTFSESGNIRKSLNLFKSYEIIWSGGLIVFGLHLIVTGCMVFNSGFFKKWIGIVLMATGFCYSLDNILKFCVVSNETFAAIMQGLVAVFSIVGEVGFGIALLRAGRK